MRKSKRLFWILMVIGLPLLNGAQQQPAQVSEYYTYPPAAVRYKERYDKTLALVEEGYTESLAEATEYYNIKLTSAKDKYNLATEKARKEYIKSLESVMNNEFRSKRDYRGQWVKYVKDLVEKVPLTPIQEHWSLSYACEARGDYNGAIRHINDGLRLSGNYYNAYPMMRVGYLYTLKGDYYKGESAYQTAVKNAPASITPLTGLLYCYVMSARTDKAIDVAQTLIKLDPMNYYANRSLAISAFTKSDYETAAGYYLRLSIAFPFDMESATNLGWCYVYMKKYREGQAIFGNVLAIAPQNQDAKDGYAYCTNMLKYEQPAVETEDDPAEDETPGKGFPKQDDPGNDK